MKNLLQVTEATQVQIVANSKKRNYAQFTYGQTAALNTPTFKLEGQVKDSPLQLGDGMLLNSPMSHNEFADFDSNPPQMMTCIQKRVRVQLHDGSVVYKSVQSTQPSADQIANSFHTAVGATSDFDMSMADVINL